MAKDDDMDFNFDELDSSSLEGGGDLDMDNLDMGGSDSVGSEFNFDSESESPAGDDMSMDLPADGGGGDDFSDVSLDSLGGESMDMESLGEDSSEMEMTPSDGNMEMGDMEMPAMEENNEGGEFSFGEEESSGEAVDFADDGQSESMGEVGDGSELDMSGGEMDFGADDDEGLALDDDDADAVETISEGPAQFDLSGEHDELDQGMEIEREVVSSGDAQDEVISLDESEMEQPIELSSEDMLMDNTEDSLLMDEGEMTGAVAAAGAIAAAGHSANEQFYAEDQMTSSDHQGFDEDSDMAIVDTSAKKAVGATKGAGGGAVTTQGLGTELLLGMMHSLTVEVGRARLSGSDITEITYGSVIELDKAAGEPVDLVLNGKVVAVGEVVKINQDKLGIRIIGVNQ